MHRPLFHPSHTIGDWPECYLEVRCAQCGKVTIGLARSLDRLETLVLDLVNRLKCHRCRRTEHRLLARHCY